MQASRHVDRIMQSVSNCFTHLTIVMIALRCSTVRGRTKQPSVMAATVFSETETFAASMELNRDKGEPTFKHAAGHKAMDSSLSTG